MLRTNTLPKSKAAAQHLAELHLRRTGYDSRLRVLSRLVEAVVGVGYAILALSMDGESGQPVEQDDSDPIRRAVEMDRHRSSSSAWSLVAHAVNLIVIAIGVFIVITVLL